MADKTAGPSVSLRVSCLNCQHQQSVGYRVQGDSGRDVYCHHPNFAGGQDPSSGPKHVGDTTWDTPGWCPLSPMTALTTAVRELKERRVAYEMRLEFVPYGSDQAMELERAVAQVNEAIEVIERMGGKR